VDGGNRNLAISDTILQCINHKNVIEKAVTVANIPQYFRNARKCHVLLDNLASDQPMRSLDDIFDNLKFIDQALAQAGGRPLVTSPLTGEDFNRRLAGWAHDAWCFPVEKSTIEYAAIEPGLLNGYSMCSNHIQSLFDHPYFSRAWCFPEMMLGKNLSIWGANEAAAFHLGDFQAWLELVREVRDKAMKLGTWVEACSPPNASTAIGTILGALAGDEQRLESLQVELHGLTSARTDIINGGPYWWRENYMGISNLLAVASI